MTLDVCRVRLSLISIWLLMTVPFAGLVRAQETTGTIYGRLTDQTGGVLPGVRILIVSVDTGQMHQTATNNVGTYTISLPIGRYEITFVLPNFQPYTTGGISLHVNDRLQIDGKLRIGVVETLTVTAQRLVQQTAAVQTLVPSVAIRELPLLTRTPVQLVTLVPGVSSDLREDACFCDQGNLDVSINGARRSAVNWLLDGASNVNGWNNYTLVTTPSLEAIQEINVITSTYSAEWGRNGGGVVNAVTKSGGQRFSGSAYDFLRNDGLNANSFFRNMDPRPEINGNPRPLRYSNFGYTIGGPALAARTRLFFFFSQEFRRSSRDQILVGTQVPDPSWLTDPGNPNYVPPEVRDPNAVKLLTLWPAPNVAGSRYEAVITNRLDTHQEFGRVDYYANANWMLTGRYLHDRVDSRGEYVADAYLTPGHRYLAAQLAVAEARSVRGRLVHEAAYQLSNHQQLRKDALPTRADLGIGILELFPENEARLVPRVIIRGPWGEAQAGGLQPSSREYINHAFSSTLSVHYGTHTVKFGGLFAAEHMNSNLSPATTQGLFIFQPAAGLTGFQHFLRGNSNGACGDSCFYSETDIDVRNQLRTRRYEAYAQDTWRLHPNITVDAGLRYAFYPPVVDENSSLFTFVPAAYDAAQAPAFTDSSGLFLAVGTGTLFNGIRAAGKDSPYGKALYAADTNNLQPRLGVAWDPRGSGRVVLRAGYGVYFDQTQLEMFAEGAQSSWLDPLRTDVVVTNASLSNPGRGASAPQVWPKPQGLLIPDVLHPGRVLTPMVFATSDHLVAPRWQHWNLGIQRRLYAGGAIDLGYIASRGDHLLRYVDLNKPQPMDLLGNGRVLNTLRPFPGYSQIIMRETTAKSRYHGLAASFRHESGAGMWATVNYTFSRNKADATYDNASIDDPQNPLNTGAEFAPALTDRSHIFNASYVYRLPFARGTTGGWRRALLQGWQIAGITRMESGPAARIRTVNCNYDDACLSPLRPNQVGDPATGDQSGLLWFNPEAFVPSAGGEYGDAPVTPFRLPGRHQWDVTVSKIIDLGARRLQFKADVINVFNHTQFLDVNTLCVGTVNCGPSFGQVVSTRPPREIQLGIRFDW